MLITIEDVRASLFRGSEIELAECLADSALDELEQAFSRARAEAHGKITIRVCPQTWFVPTWPLLRAARIGRG